MKWLNITCSGFFFSRTSSSRRGIVPPSQPILFTFAETESCKCFKILLLPIQNVKTMRRKLYVLRYEMPYVVSYCRDIMYKTVNSSVSAFTTRFSELMVAAKMAAV